LFIALPLAGFAQSGGSAAPLEVKKTVDAFLGRWALTGTYTESGSKNPSHLTVTIQCESALLGAVVICGMASDDTGGGHIEVASIIGYSPDERRIHLMEASSSGSYHEHKGRWIGDVIQFERLSKSEAGKQIVEDFSIGFPSPGTMRVKSIEETPEGRSTMDIVGKKQAEAR
jgi:hypothetical protein